MRIPALFALLALFCSAAGAQQHYTLEAEPIAPDTWLVRGSTAASIEICCCGA